ncbi:MAG: phosphoribosylamine--glycine ligase [Cytophagales bacterium]|nr:phosphoribosylamine--glycine ligase [Cytophagales bacterium]MDW8385285.1 phosphoribosylamine--glycine ligase [Flammeovirgaceae bacterium]
MNVLILGSGGREHAFAWKIAQSPLLTKLYVAPGNAGTSQIAQNVEINPLDFEAVAAFCLEKEIRLVLVGPEAPLCEGIVDYFRNRVELGFVRIIGPDKFAAQLEGSKDFAKTFMKKYNIPTAEARTFSAQNIEEGYRFLERLSSPYVLKADGLAAGKGVIILNDLDEAKLTLRHMILNAKFGKASEKVLIEEHLKGIEMSVFVLTDGQDYLILPPAKDYKRVGNGDTGLNTGGMGAVSPLPFADKQLMRYIERHIIRPTIEGIKKENMHYVGFIFFGLMVTKNSAKVIEYNVRMGDPEAEVVIPLIENDLLELLDKAVDKKLHKVSLQVRPMAASTVMLVSAGYPEEYTTGVVILGLNKLSEANVIPFHAGTKMIAPNVVTNGGRVIALTALGNTLAEALEKSYRAAEMVKYQGKYYRTDIGQDILHFNMRSFKRKTS